MNRPEFNQANQQKSQTSINSLNAKCILSIFEHLPVRDLMVCSAVVKSWHKLIAKIEFEQLAIYLSKPVDNVMPRYLQFNSTWRLEEVLRMAKFGRLKKLIICVNNQQLAKPRIDLAGLNELVHLEINYLSTNQSMFDALKSQRIRLHRMRFFNCYRVDLIDLFQAFPNLTHLKAATVEVPNSFTLPESSFPLGYLEQYHYMTMHRTVFDFLASHCRATLRRLTCTTNDPAACNRLVQNCVRLLELNLNIENQHLDAFFPHRTEAKQSVLFAQAIAERQLLLRINGLVVRLPDSKPTKFAVDPDEVFLTTYDQLLTANELTGYSKNELRFYFNNFKEIEIATEQQPIQPIKHLVAYDLMLKRVKNLTFHFKNKSSCCYFFELFFRRLPNVEHLFIAEVENLTEYQLNKLPVLFPKLSNLELHVGRKDGRFALGFICKLTGLQRIIIKSGGFIVTAGFGEVIKNLKYLSHLEVDPIYYDLFDFLFEQLRKLWVQCHLHAFTSDPVERPATMDGVCFQRHTFNEGFIFEYFNDHNYRF